MLSEPLTTTLCVSSPTSALTSILCDPVTVTVSPLCSYTRAESKVNVRPDIWHHHHLYMIHTGTCL